jgi:1-acyl-sn-glycerol-3-phosphate acyltransferase
MGEAQGDVLHKKLTGTEQAGRFFGEHVMLPVLDLLLKKVEQFTITPKGLENVSKAQHQSCLFVSNHEIPVNAALQQLQISPDALVIQHVVKEAAGVPPQIIAKAGDGWWSPNAMYRTFQEKYMPAVKEAVKAAGLIPVNKNPGAVNTELLHSVEQAVRDGNSLLIFPEGNWYQDFSVDHPLSDGAAFMAMKFALPIIPVYIHGADDWKKGQEVSISFGKPFESTGEGKTGRQQTTKMIRSAIAELQSHFT